MKTARFPSVVLLLGLTFLAVTAGAAKGALRVRSLQPGDRITWHGVQRKVSDVMVNEKVPVWERPGMVVLADAARVLGLFGPARTFVADMQGEPELWVRLAVIPQPPA